MQIKVPNISISPDSLIKRCGYAELRTKRGQVSYVRRLRGYQYPRFHIYCERSEQQGSERSEGSYIEKGCFNLHLDQKAPIYKGVTAHSGEYDGEVVEKEAIRIKQIINKY